MYYSLKKIFIPVSISAELTESIYIQIQLFPRQINFKTRKTIEIQEDY